MHQIVTLRCEEELNKKFCDDSCRNTTINQQNSASTNLIRKYQHALKKRIGIFSITHSPKGRSLHKTTKDKLLRLDFQFNISLTVTKPKQGSEYYFAMILVLKMRGDWFFWVVKGKGELNPSY